ncbi:UNVERIFIED_CONTAM: Serine/threonine-protein phosphatase 7 long form [Sesamum angustifolium]|uniref:Serine/threonine-protein phosphatase 7 long form n=1 Tax=Sesamum angustifolium TaxID=2727405 RepID=A0AAW2IUD5_9LAMI
MANFGPINTSVLYGQANHRSEDVFGDPDATLTVRRGDISFFRVLQLVHVTFVFYKCYSVTEYEFLGILQCGHIEIYTHLITALVERWRPETHTFHFSVGEATVTLQDISIIWALPIEALLDLLLKNTCDDESPFDDVLQEARVCVMCIIGGILCPDATVLAYLYRELCMASQRGKTNIGGAMQLLQIWAWSRILTLAPIPSNNAADLMPTVIDVENILPIPPYAARFLIILAQQTLQVIAPLTLVIGNMWMEQLVLDCDNSGDDIQSLRETRARNRAIGRDIMTFSSARYPSVHSGPAGDEAGPSNVYTPSGPSNVYNEAGPSNVYNEAGPSNVYNEAGPSNFFTPTGPSYDYTSNMPFSSGDYAHNIHPETGRHLGISPVPFDGSDLNTPIEEQQDIHPRRNRRRPRCGTGGHY